MAVRNGSIADANEVLALQKYALVSAGQNFINSMKVASPHTDYTFIKGRHIGCNQGNLEVHCSASYLPSMQGTISNSYCTLWGWNCEYGPNTCTLTDFGLIMLCADYDPSAAYGRVCGGRLCLGGTKPVGSSYHGGSSTVCFGRGLADYYELCVLCGTISGRQCIYASLSFGGLTLVEANISSGSQSPDEAKSISPRKYTLCKVGNAYKYCLYCDGVFQCCIEPTEMSGFKATAGFYGCVNGTTSLIIGCTYEATYNSNPAIYTCNFSTGEAPQYLLGIINATDNCGVLRYSLLNCAGVPLFENLEFNKMNYINNTCEGPFRLAITSDASIPFEDLPEVNAFALIPISNEPKL